MKTEANDRHWFETFTLQIEQNVLGVKLGIYGLGLIGLGIAFRSIRPFKKFTSPSDIPQSFVDKNIKLSGKVLRVEYSPKTLLVINHRPLLGSTFRKPAGLLVSFEGINISGNGVSWLQSLIVGKEVDFLVLVREQEYASCLVYQKNRDIGKYLISIGFASVAPFNSSLESNKLYAKYYKGLLEAEDLAEKRGVGMWWDKPTTNIAMLNLMFSKFVLMSKSVFQKLRSTYNM